MKNPLYCNVGKDKIKFYVELLMSLDFKMHPVLKLKDFNADYLVVNPNGTLDCAESAYATDEVTIKELLQYAVSWTPPKYYFRELKVGERFTNASFPGYVFEKLKQHGINVKFRVAKVITPVNDNGDIIVFHDIIDNTIVEKVS